MNSVNEYLAKFSSAFGSPEQIRMMIPMNTSHLTLGSVRESLYKNIIGHIRNLSDESPIIDLLDDVLMMLAESDQMTIEEAKAILRAVDESHPELFGRYEETILENAPSDEFLDALRSA